jgi:hypothetical protein
MTSFIASRYCRYCGAHHRVTVFLLDDPWVCIKEQVLFEQAKCECGKPLDVENTSYIRPETPLPNYDIVTISIPERT